MGDDVLFELEVSLLGGPCLIRAYDDEITQQPYGHRQIGTELIFNGRTVFPRGATYCAVPSGKELDGDFAKELVLSLFAMKPGDTDPDYFDSYTSEQLEFARAYGDEFTLEAEDRFPGLAR
jgi:hypothetical protein